MARENEAVVVVIGGGGRVAAVAEAHAKSKLVKKVLAVPGNDAVDLVTQGKLIDRPEFRNIKTNDTKSIIQICKYYGATQLDVPEDDAVAAGVVDAARAKGINTVGPTKAAGQIESDKGLARFIGRMAGIKQPGFMEFNSQEFAMDCIKMWPEQTRWIKAVGLAKGKGAMRANTREEAYECISSLGQFGEAGRRFLIEDNLVNDDGTPGEEFSYFVLCKGREFTYLGSAQDNKPIGNGDTGPNTGGMGGQNEPDVVDKETRLETENNMIAPILNFLAELDCPYDGVLYASGMKINRNRELMVMLVEWNARWGDPEAQIILPGIKNDWFEVGMHLAEGGSLKDLKVERDNLRRVVVTIAAKGYPGDYSDVMGKRILGIDRARSLPGVRLYGAGIKYDGQDYRVAGGRVIHVMGEGADLVSAVGNAYRGVHAIRIEGNNQVFRDDIAWREAERILSKGN